MYSNIDFTRIIESLETSLPATSLLHFDSPLGVENFYELYNTVIYVKEGTLYYGKENTAVQSGEVLFIPSGKKVHINFQSPTPKRTIQGGLQGDQKSFIKEHSTSNLGTGNAFAIFFVTAEVFNAINLFSSLDIPPFVVQYTERINYVISTAIEETQGNDIGKKTMLEALIKELITCIVRYIIKNQLFVQQIITNISNLHNDRLISLLKHINQNLPKDLSNKQLSQIVNVSQDYVGQYFKALTGINPQDYIEFQRMQRAVYLLRNTDKGIAEIGKEIGYKDSSYFCRRFKMMFGISARRMRSRERGVEAKPLRSQINLSQSAHDAHSINPL